MTGYASAQLSSENASNGGKEPPLLVEVRSVNNRFLDVSFKIPDELRAHEGRWRQLVTGKLRRGKVEVRWARAPEVPSHGDLVGDHAPSATDLARLATAQAAVLAAMPDARPLGVADVLRLSSASAAWAWPAASTLDDLLDSALTALLDARAREGERLAQALRQCLNTLRALAQQAEPLVAQSIGLQRERFLARWREALDLVGGSGAVSAQTAQERAVAEVAAFAIRVDVAEELARLRSHLDDVEQLLNKGGELGKRLDFLMQELHREVNTLGSKSAHLALTRLSVDMKVQVEQMREQVQNIE
jgi:uncharacterized protein (TIGR00255 family)